MSSRISSRSRRPSPVSESLYIREACSLCKSTERLDHGRKASESRSRGCQVTRRFRRIAAQIPLQIC